MIIPDGAPVFLAGGGGDGGGLGLLQVGEEQEKVGGGTHVLSLVVESYHGTAPMGQTGPTAAVDHRPHTLEQSRAEAGNATDDFQQGEPFCLAQRLKRNPRPGSGLSRVPANPPWQSFGLHMKSGFLWLLVWLVFKQLC